MITPSFRCSQHTNTVHIEIYCPAVRAADLELHVDDTLVSAHINPYFLRINLPGPVTEDDQSSAAYDAATGYLNLTLTKCLPGQEFKDLDLLSKLLAPRQPATSPGPPSIEVLSDDPSDIGPTEEDEYVDEAAQLSDRMHQLSLERQEILKAAENDWQLPQEIPSPFPLETAVKKQYGFLNRHSGYFAHVTHTENEVNELGADAETCSLAVRRSLRLKHEQDRWDEEHYIADFADDEYIQELSRWKIPWLGQNDSASPFEFTEDENTTMMRLPRKEYLMTSSDNHNLYLTLITILFSFVYETRTTQDDLNPESAWTMCTLIPAFSALDPPPYSASTQSSQPASFLPDIGISISHSTSTFISPSNPNPPSQLATALIPSYRRSLIFPLYRSFALSEQCRADVAQILQKGQRVVTRCLLRLKDILDHHEVYYVYSKIWLDDLCVWAQSHATDETLKAMGDQLAQVKIDKSALGLDLEELEAAVRRLQNTDSEDEDDSSDSDSDSSSE